MSIMLFNEDCTIAFDKIPSQSVDLVLTDPPYNLGLFMRDRDTNLKKMRSNYFGAAGWDDLDEKTWMNSMELFFSNLSSVMKPKSSVIVFMAIIKVSILIEIAMKHGFYYKTTGIWHKTNPMPRNMNLHFVNSTEAWIYFTFGARTGTFNNCGKMQHDFFETSSATSSERKYGSHPTQKPIALMLKFVSLLSNENDVVFDPFMGSGSAGVAAKMLNRNFIGVEINKQYYETAQKRIAEVLL